MTTIELASVELHLLADRALWVPAEQTLLIADVHLGKAEVLQSAGLALPSPDPAHHPDLARIARLLARHCPRRLVVLGDLIHAHANRGSGWLDALAHLIGANRACEFALIAGNHDRDLGPLRELLDIWPEGSQLARLALHHVPPAHEHAPFVAGHIHPVVRVKLGRMHHRCPIFWRTDRGLVLPAFGSQTGGHAIHPAAADDCYACVDEGVYLLPPAKLRDRSHRAPETAQKVNR